MRPPRCPLCEAALDGDQDLRAHLASVHDLEDDPGTTSSFESLALHAVPAGHGALLTEPAVEVPDLRVYDPYADDDRWRPIVIGVGGFLVLVFAVVAMTVGA